MRQRSRTGVWSPRRECANCGKLFRVPLVKRSVPTGSHVINWQYSRRRTCSKRCANDVRGTAIEAAHERVRNENPERYREWMARDYAAMARKAAASKLNPKGRSK